MKKFLFFLSSKSFWIFLGVIGLIALIWLIGPLVAIGESKPLASFQTRTLVCLIIVMIWIGLIVFKHVREARRNAKLLQEIRAAQEPILKESSDVGSMSKQFSEITSVLKNAKFSASKSKFFSKFDDGQYLYQMPWYVVLGAAGSGKTTALKQAGLNFPLESTFGTSLSGLAGTRDCDWFLSDDAVLLDTAGRLSLHEDGNEKDSEDWEEFISLLKRYRPKQPINGVIFTVGVDDLLNDNSSLAEMAMEFKRRINEMYAKFGIKFPVYLVVTKLDLLHGFNEYFDCLDENQRAQYLGINLSEKIEAETPIANIVGFLNEMLTKLRFSVFGVINELELPSSKAAAFLFPEEIEKLNLVILNFLKELTKSSKFDQALPLQGVFFSSATQKGEVFNPVLEGLSNEFHLTQKYVSTERNQKYAENKSFFLNKLFTDIIFKEATLASEDKSWFIKNRTLYWLSVSLIGIVTLLVLVAMTNSYANNSNYLSEVSDKASKLSKKIDSQGNTDNLIAAISLAEEIEKTVDNKDLTNLSKPPLSYRLGLYQGKQMQMVGESTYQRILNDSVNPLISYRIDDLLRNGVKKEKVDAYNALKAYLMMFDKKHLDPAFLQSWLMSNVVKDGDVSSEQLKSIERALEQILYKQNLSPSVPYDENLIELRRQEIAKNDISSMLLDNVLKDVSVTSGDSFAPVSFSSMGGAQSHLLFRRLSGSSLKTPINYLYTKEVYNKKILPSLIQHAESLFGEKDWVLGSYASLSNSKISVIKEAQQTYFNNYIKEWNIYIHDLTLVKAKSTRDNIQISKLLSDKNSPLVNIIKGISSNTTLAMDSQGQLNNNVKNNSDNKEKLNEIVASGSKELLDELAELKLSAPVDDAFSDYHILTKSGKDQVASINGVVDAINELYVYLVAVSVAVDKGVDLPPDDPFVKYKAEVNRLPSPFREMLDNFSVVIMKNTDEVLDEKLMSSLEKQLASVNLSCLDILEQGYPFKSASNENVSIESFANLFGPNGLYQKFQTLSGKTAVLAKTDNLADVRTKNENFDKKFSKLDEISLIRQVYFGKGLSSPEFDFSVKVIHLDDGVDNLSIIYDGKELAYSHGPIMPVSFNWPAKGDNSVFNLNISSPKIGTVGIHTSGPWSIFKMIEKGRIKRQSLNTTIVEYNIQGKKVVLEITTFSSYNPFDINRLRNFQCL